MFFVNRVESLLEIPTSTSGKIITFPITESRTVTIYRDTLDEIAQ